MGMLLLVGGKLWVCGGMLLEKEGKGWVPCLSAFLFLFVLLYYHALIDILFNSMCYKVFCRNFYMICERHFYPLTWTFLPTCLGSCRGVYQQRRSPHYYLCCLNI
jgi:hypothetical protein